MTDIPPVLAWRNAIRSEDGPTDPITRLVLLNLSFWMDAYGDGAEPSMRVQAHQTGLGLRTVERHLKHASETGWLVRQRQKRGRYSYFVPEEFSTSEGGPVRVTGQDPSERRHGPVRATGQIEYMNRELFDPSERRVPIPEPRWERWEREGRGDQPGQELREAG